MDKENKTGQKESKLKGKNSALKYAGLATTMFFSLLISWYLGSWLDAYFKNEIQFIGLSFVMLTLFAYFYKLIKELS